jgi:hypothetical protein
MTEEQAKTKWCPMARVTTSDPRCHASWNIVSGEGASYSYQHCIASECMMWAPSGYSVEELGGKFGHCGLVNTNTEKLVWMTNPTTKRDYVTWKERS